MQYVVSCWCVIVGWFLLLLTGTAMSGGVPDLYVADSVLEMGNVLEGAPARGSITVFNRGQSPLVINKVGRSAGGIVHGIARHIAPGQAGSIEIGFTTWNMQGASECAFFVYSNDPDTPRLKLRAKAQVTPLISVKPDRIYFSGFADQTYRTVITLRGNADAPLRICSIADSLEDRVSYSLKPVDQGKAYRLEVSAQPPPGSYFRGRFTLETSYADKPRLHIPVLVRILKDVEVMPVSLDFGIRLRKDYVKPAPDQKVRLKDWQANQYKLPKTVFLRVNRGQSVHVTEVILKNKLFQKQLQTGEEGLLYMVTVTPLIEQMSPGRYQDLLKIRTDHPSHPTYDVPVQVTVK